MVFVWYDTTASFSCSSLSETPPLTPPSSSVRQTNAVESLSPRRRGEREEGEGEGEGEERSRRSRKEDEED